MSSIIMKNEVLFTPKEMKNELNVHFLLLSIQHTYVMK